MLPPTALQTRRALRRFARNRAEALRSSRRFRTASSRAVAAVETTSSPAALVSRSAARGTKPRACRTTLSVLPVPMNAHVPPASQVIFAISAR